MHIDGSSISCGVKRLSLNNKEAISKQNILTTIDAYRNSCAMMFTTVPARNKAMIASLEDSGFFQVKNPNAIQFSNLIDESVNSNFLDMFSMICNHGNENYIDGATMFDDFINGTINNKLTKMAAMTMQHGNELIGDLNFYVCYMGK